MENEDLHDILFSSNAGFGSQPNSKCMTPQLYTSTLSNNFNSSHLPPKSENKTREDLEELIGKIPCPNDLSLTSFASSMSNTPQKFKQYPSTNRQPPDTSEERPPNTMRTNMKSGPRQMIGLSSDKRSHSDHFGSASQNRPRHLDFDNQNHVIFEENLTQESFTPSHLRAYVPSNQKNITPSSNNLFPDIVAPTLEISADGSLSQSHSQVGNRFQLIKSPNNDIHDNTIDRIHEKDAMSDHKSPNNRRALPTVGDSRVRIEIKRLQDQLAVTENELSFQKKKYNNLEQENHYLTQRINELEEHLGMLQERYNNNTPLENIRGHNLSNAKTQLKQVKSLLEKKEEKIAELSSQIQHLKKNDQIYRESVETELANLHLEIERTKILSTSHQNRAQELEKKLSEAFENNLVNAQRKDQQKDELLHERESQNKRIADLNTEIKKNEQTIKKLASHVDEVQDLLEKATNKLEEKEREVDMLKKQTENFLVEQHKLSNLESNNTWERRCSQLEDELMRVKEMKEKEIIRLKEKMLAQNDKIKYMEESFTRDNNNLSIQHLEDDSVNVKALAAKEEEMSKMKAQYDKEILRYRRDMEELNQKINSLEKKENVADVLGIRDINKPIPKSNATGLVQNLLNSLGIYSSSHSFDLEDSLSKVSEHVGELRGKIQDLEKNIVEFRKRQISMNSDLDCTKMENEQLKETLREFQYKEAESAEKKIALHNEIADLKRTIISLESQQSARYETGGVNTSRDLGTGEDFIRQEYMEMKQKYNTLEEEYDNAREQLQKLQMKCQGMELELKRTTSQLQRSKDDMELLKLELESKSSNDKNHWETVKKNLTEKAKSLEQRNENLIEENRKREIENAELKGKIEFLESEVKHHEKEHTQHLEESKRETSFKIPQLEKKIKELQGEVLNKEEELDTLKLKVRELEFDLEQERGDSQDITRKSQQKHQRLEEEVRNLREENNTLMEQMQRLNESLEKRDLEINRLLSEKLVAQSENERLCIGLDQGKNLEDVVNRLNETLNIRDRQLGESKLKIEDLTNEIKREKEKYRELKEAEIEKERRLETVSTTLREKENELKYIIESAKKKETQDSKQLLELTSKTKELEKLQTTIGSLEKEIDILKKEKLELTKALESAKANLEKSEQEGKKKEESLRQLQDTNKKNGQYLKDKDKANLDLFNINKSLKENLKTLGETHATLNTENEQKAKILSQKNAEIKKLTQSNKTLEESNQELTNEVMELKIKLQQMESDHHSHQNIETALKERNLNLNEENWETNETKTTRESVKSARPTAGKTNSGSKNNNQNIEKLLQCFTERESEFENIKHSFVDKLMSMNEKLALSEQRYQTLAEENQALVTQIGLYENANHLQNEKLKKLENVMNQWSSFNDTGVADSLQKMETRADALSSLRKTQSGLEDYEYYRNMDLDELKPPSNYEPNPMRTLGRDDYEMRSTFKTYDEKQITNVFNNNILDMVSPEMLSTEDTITLMLEMMRRASQSHKLAVTLGRNYEFKELTNSIRKHCALEEQSEFGYGNETVSFSGKIRKQYATNENFYPRNTTHL